MKQIIATLNPVLRGWGNYFRTGNADREFNQMDGYVDDRFARLDVSARRTALHVKVDAMIV